MEPVKVNLSTFEYRYKRIVKYLLTGISILLFFFILNNIYLVFRYHKEILECEKKIERLGHILAEKEKDKKERKMIIGEKEIETAQDKIVFANRLIANDIFPWDQVLDTIENRMPESIILKNLSISNNFDKLILKGFARSVNKITLFLKNLEEADIFKKIVLMNLSVAQEDRATRTDGGKIQIVLFEIESTFFWDKLFQDKMYGNLGKIIAQSVEKR